MYSFRFENKVTIQTTGSGTNSARGSKQQHSAGGKKDAKKMKKEQELTGKDV